MISLCLFRKEESYDFREQHVSFSAALIYVYSLDPFYSYIVREPSGKWRP